MINHSVIIKSNHWPRRLSEIEKILSNILKYERYFSFNKKVIYFCNLVLMNDHLIKKFNKLYKKNNKSTDVLTFILNVKKNRVIEKHCDIMISAETLTKDAKKNKKTFYEHFTHLIVHSFLHINGYNHDNNKNFLIMQKKEIIILKKIGISNPY